MKWSPKQKRFIKESTALINIAHGSVRSGKTYSSLMRWAKHVIEAPDDKLYMIGHSQESIYENAVKPFMDDLFRGYCTWYPGKHVLNFSGKDIKCIGAKDQGSVRRITGNTHTGSYVDEMTLIPQNFIDMLTTRLSTPDPKDPGKVYSKLFATTNPSSPYHNVKQMIDRADGKNVFELHFTLEDNPFLEEDYLNLIKSIHTGLFYRRNVLGEWVMAEGAIYDFFDKKYHVVDEPPTAAQFYIAGIDYGTSNPLCCLLIGFNPNIRPALWVEKEYYYDPKAMGRQQTDGQFADQIQRFLEPYNVRVIYLDPSAQSMEVELRQRQMRVKQADNDVLNGIRTVSNFLGSGDLVICNQAQNLIREIEGYVWDSKKIEKGEDVPLKVRDHAVDTLRYCLFTHFGTNTKFIPTKAPHELWKEKEQRKYQKNPLGYLGQGWQSF